MLAGLPAPTIASVRAAIPPLVELPHPILARDGVPLVLTELARSGDPHPAPGPAVVLVHGFAQNRSAYLEGPLPAELIGRGLRVFLGELRGHGRSRRAGSPHTHALVDHLREDLPAILEAASARAGGDGVTLVGHSMGGVLGYGLLAAPGHLRALVTLGAPVVLGTGRPVLRAAARAVGPLVRRVRAHELPMDHLLRLLAPVVALPPTGGPGRLLREVIRLGNPREADVAALRRVLSSADPAARAVLIHLVEIIERGRAVIGGVDLEEAVGRSTLPIAAVVAGRDIFAPRVSVAPILRGKGLRRIVEWPEAAHVDLTMGHRTGELADLIREVVLETTRVRP